MLLSKERFLYLAVICLLSVGLAYLLFSGNEEYVGEYKTKIQTLGKKVDSLDVINDGLTLKIDTLNQEVIKLDHEIDLKDNRIKTLKKVTNEKVNAVDSFNSDELERFFTERYRHYSDSIKKTDSPSSN
jgi:predicted RNase H-like nuclease (RuvC/YqgF family)